MIAAAGRKPDRTILEREYPVDRQRVFAEAAAAAVGFDFHAGRLDTTTHPFFSTIGPGDCRITTRFAENVLDSTNAFDYLITNEEGLAGLPPSAIDAARHSAESKGLAGWRFTLQAPSFTPIMTYLDDAAVRETFYRAHTVRATQGEQAADSRSNGDGLQIHENPPQLLS